jgi:hypothetical protein
MAECNIFVVSGERLKPEQEKLFEMRVIAECSGSRKPSGIRDGSRAEGRRAPVIGKASQMPGTARETL